MSWRPDMVDSVTTTARSVPGKGTDDRTPDARGPVRDDQVPALFLGHLPGLFPEQGRPAGLSFPVRGRAGREPGGPNLVEETNQWPHSRSRKVDGMGRAKLHADLAALAGTGGPPCRRGPPLRWPRNGRGRCTARNARTCPGLSRPRGRRQRWSRTRAPGWSRRWRSGASTSRSQIMAFLGQVGEARGQAGLAGSALAADNGYLSHGPRPFPRDSIAARSRAKSMNILLKSWDIPARMCPLAYISAALRS